MNKKAITGGIIVVCVVGLAATGIVRAVQGGNVIQVKTARIEKGNISSYISADGTVEETDKAEVFFDTPFKVRKVLAEVGQRVKKGQQLLELDLDDLNSQLEILKINRNTQQNSIDSKAADTEVQQALSNLEAAERNYDNSKKAYEDNKALYEADAISKAELDMSERALKEAELGAGGLGSVKMAYDMALENRKNARSAAQDNIRVTDIQIKDLKRKIATLTENCLSPMDGVVTAVGTQEGSFTNAAGATFTIIDPDKLRVRAKVKEYDIKNVAAGQRVKITGEAIAEGVEVTGSVKSIAPVAVTNITANGNETAVEIMIDVVGGGNSLKPGLNVTCDIAAVERKSAVLAPMEALTLDKDDNNMVFKFDEETKTLKQQKVATGLNSDMNVEILEGLEEGDIVVLDPQPSYSDGMRVRMQEE